MQTTWLTVVIDGGHIIESFLLLMVAVFFIIFIRYIVMPAFSRKEARTPWEDYYSQDRKTLLRVFPLQYEYEAGKGFNNRQIIDGGMIETVVGMQRYLLIAL